MASLVECAACTGLMPAQSTSCPHCHLAEVDVGSVGSGSPSRLVKVALTLIAGTAFGVTLMACYGAPPVCEGENGCGPEDAGDTSDAGTDEDAGSDADAGT